MHDVSDVVKCDTLGQKGEHPDPTSLRRLLMAKPACYTSLARRRPYSSAVIDPDFFSWSSLVISSATL